MQVKVFSRDESRSRNFLGTLQQGTGKTDLFIDLDFDQQDKNEQLISLSEQNPHALFLVNSVCETLEKLPDNFIRFNGWESFLERHIMEVAGKNGEAKFRIEEFSKQIGKTTEWVPDVPGFLSARVVAMIINEAYFTLQDGVSSREDIDTAMKLGTNYPYGPFEWSRKIGLKKINQLLDTLSLSNPRYLPAALLKQEATTL